MTNPLRPGDPRQLGGYRLLSRLGEGGMGTVYLARSDGGRLVAVKVIRSEYAAEDEFRARFRSEVNRARQVPPFCTAEVLDADPEHPTPYLVVEYVDGPSLADVVADQGPLTAGSLHSVAIGVATALVAIHGAGVIHRDLKPRNVLFSLGTPKVIDFGIARALEVTSQHTRTDQMVGTVSYMAPERFDAGHRAISPAADVFAWGAVVSYAGTGRTPFSGDSPAATAARILTQPPRLDGLSGPLRDLVELTLVKDPEQRPAAHELLDMLLAAGPHGRPALAADLAQQPELRRAAEAAQHTGRHVTGDPKGTRPDATAIRPPATRRRRAATWVAAGAVVTAAVVLGATAAIQAQADPELSGANPSAPGGSKSPSVPPTSAARVALPGIPGPSVIDPLDRPGQWKPVRDNEGRCVFDKALVVSTAEDSVFRCPGPTDSFAGDQSIEVDVALRDTGSCAQIWFRSVSTSAYLLSACPDRIEVKLDTDLAATTLSSVPSALFLPGQRHRIRIEIRGDTAAVSVDGTPATSAAVTERTLVAGQVAFGVTTTDGSDTASASFADAELRSL